jgi:hypothetical protein
MAGAFHVIDDGGAGNAVQHVHRQQHHDAIGVDDIPGQRDHAQPVGVAVEGQAQVSVHQAHGLDQVFEVVRLAGVRMMIGESAVDLVEQGQHFDADRAQRVRRANATDTVAAVYDHLEGPLDLDVAGNLRDVLGHHVPPARSRGSAPRAPQPR